MGGELWVGVGVWSGYVGWMGTRRRRRQWRLRIDGIERRLMECGRHGRVKNLCGWRFCCPTVRPNDRHSCTRYAVNTHQAAGPRKQAAGPRAKTLGCADAPWRSWPEPRRQDGASSPESSITRTHSAPPRLIPDFNSLPSPRAESIYHSPPDREGPPFYHLETRAHTLVC